MAVLPCTVCGIVVLLARYDANISPGAPECGRYDIDGKPIPVSQKIDTWSFGCILSIAATWSLSGISGIRNFERRLKIALLDTGIHTPCFHDGRNVLSDVTRWHKDLRRNIRPHDHITPGILDLIDDHLLQGDPKVRFDSKELCGYMNQLMLHKERRSDAPVYIHGLGGMGKTQIALEYLYNHHNSVSQTFWIETNRLQASNNSEQVNGELEHALATTSGPRDSRDCLNAIRHLESKRLVSLSFS
jgi:hypothetical protein